jgi:hypothetical protein
MLGAWQSTSSTTVLFYHFLKDWEANWANVQGNRIRMRFSFLARFRRAEAFARDCAQSTGPCPSPIADCGLSTYECLALLLYNGQKTTEGVEQSKRTSACLLTLSAARPGNEDLLRPASRTPCRDRPPGCVGFTVESVSRFQRHNRVAVADSPRALPVLARRRSLQQHSVG